MLAGPAAPSLRAMPRRGPLIGRDVEQAELGGILAEAAGGRGGVALVAGEAGVGKTRLVEATVHAAGLRVLRGHAVEEATPPFGPLAAALRSQLRDDPAGLPDCGPLTPYLALLLPELGVPPPDGDPGALLEALRRLLEEPAPVVVFLDDLQWADQAAGADAHALSRLSGVTTR